MQVLLLRVLQEREFERLGGRPHRSSRRPSRRRHQSRSRRRSPRRPLPQRPLLSSQCFPRARSRASRTPRRHSAARRALRRKIWRTLRPPHLQHRPQNPRSSCKLTIGPATCANSKTPSSAPSFSRATASSASIPKCCATRAPPPQMPLGRTDDFIGRAHRDRKRASKTSRGKVSGAKGAAKKIGIPASTLEFRIKKLGINKFRFRHIDRRGLANNAIRSLTRGHQLRHLSATDSRFSVNTTGKRSEKPGQKRPGRSGCIGDREDRAQPEWPVSSRILRSFAEFMSTTPPCSVSQPRPIAPEPRAAPQGAAFGSRPPKLHHRRIIQILFRRRLHRPVSLLRRPRRRQIHPQLLRQIHRQAHILIHQPQRKARNDTLPSTS